MCKSQTLGVFLKGKRWRTAPLSSCTVTVDGGGGEPMRLLLALSPNGVDLGVQHQLTSGSQTHQEG